MAKESMVQPGAAGVAWAPAGRAWIAETASAVAARKSHTLCLARRTPGDEVTAEGVILCFGLGPVLRRGVITSHHGGWRWRVGPYGTCGPSYPSCNSSSWHPAGGAGPDFPAP